MAILTAAAVSTVSTAVAAPLRVWIRVVVTELALIALGAGAYLAVSAGAADRADAATANAAALVRIEAALGLDVERSLAAWWAADATRAALANAYYVAAHFAVPVVIFGLLALCRPDAYRRYRTAFVAASLLGVAVSWIWPTAPPRLVGGFADAPVISGAENPYAAFPSMHVGWAVWAALAVTALTARWWLRTLAWLHAIVTSMDVLVTGHHWALDVVGGVLAALAGVAVARGWERFAGNRT
ncbi:phosphatase PAP2 family protein [Cryptosporangium aurantiacum]|uniref:PAP2 superfamily protein n=1 Tax=Cryptosporangium aurantiacum TaxID=134849 RepID=A0A1M7RL15_9ACTN|nr:phosphatase PAP2 family protein [Cryptosporangium aurantiacum]SHN47035.1 PAP2 superfamily protein [Cryptosporangium aurantiacum]